MANDSKNREELVIEINKIREKFGKAPIGSEKNYEDRLEEDKKRPHIKRK